MSTQRQRAREGKAVRVCDRLAAAKSLRILMQDYPDPDALGAAAALRELAHACGVSSVSLTCAGFIGRAENKALLRYLNLNVQSLATVDTDQSDCLALVDTQPGTGNNGLLPDQVPDIVIDHHPLHQATRRVPLYDVRRNYGATSTILHEYSVSAGLTLSVPVVTALLYGIRSDTNDFGREAGQADQEAFLALYPRSNKRMLGRIRMARVPRAYFEAMRTVLNRACSYGQCLVSDLGRIDNPDMVAEMADLLLRDEETSWALCCGVYEQRLLISLRTSDLQADAGQVIQRAVGRRGTGGGHQAMAGGQIVLREGEDVTALAQAVIGRTLRALRISDKDARPLIRTCAQMEPSSVVGNRYHDNSLHGSNQAPNGRSPITDY